MVQWSRMYMTLSEELKLDSQYPFQMTHNCLSCSSMGSNSLASQGTHICIAYYMHMIKIKYIFNERKPQDFIKTKGYDAPSNNNNNRRIKNNIRSNLYTSIMVYFFFQIPSFFHALWIKVNKIKLVFSLWSVVEAWNGWLQIFKW